MPTEMGFVNKLESVHMSIFAGKKSKNKMKDKKEQPKRIFIKSFMSINYGALCCFIQRACD